MNQRICKVHKRRYPTGERECLLCQLAAGDELDMLAAERRRRLVEAFPKRDLGGHAAAVRAEEGRVARRLLSLRKFSKTTLIAADPIDRF